MMIIDDKALLDRMVGKSQTNKHEKMVEKPGKLPGIFFLASFRIGFTPPIVEGSSQDEGSVVS